MIYDNSNVFAKILRNELPCNKIYESEYSLAFYDISPQATIHALVITKCAYVSFADFSARASEAEIVGYIRDIGEVARLLGVEADGYRLIANHGANANQEVPHLHVHIFAGQKLGSLLSPSQ
ncbi:HIT domain-containing protein [Candidatus Persebacteraceae bacterium Df01]|jgi:diadenosine tetraphosphate (Ap4A) HIT family hydrolase|uniref:HIT domain-containing protein n=1 Tax=Candidatus Doriopsillibacter californiensis TaxID=2970740 RepID=A0ABT7QJX2_9GAMM|nr:HIT domain-containing protein [Candidatus Persebacteraceae bacterium Df01]